MMKFSRDWVGMKNCGYVDIFSVDSSMYGLVLLRYLLFAKIRGVVGG